MLMTLSNMQPIGTKAAMKAAQRLCGYFLQSAATDPQIFITGLVQLFSSYPLTTIEAVLSPISGIPAKHKFMPSIAEIHEECEDRYSPIRDAELRRRGEEQSAEFRAAYATPRIDGSPAPRPTLAELKTKH